MEKVGEMDLKSRNRMDFGLFLKDSAIQNAVLLSLPFISLLPFFTNQKDDPVQLWLKAYPLRLLK